MVKSITLWYHDHLLKKLTDGEREMLYILRQSSRKKELVKERFLFIANIRNKYHLSYPDIGLLMNRDHSTIIHGYRKGMDMLSTHTVDKKQSNKAVK